MSRNSNTKKEEILIQSFNVLKDDIEEHKYKLAEIIGKMSAINLELAVDMWKYLLQNARSILKEDGYTLTGGIIHDIKENNSMDEVIDILKDHEDIFEACFGIANEPYHYIVTDAFSYGEIDFADRVLETINNNPYKEDSFASYLEDVCEFFVEEFEDIHTFDEFWDDHEEHDKKVEIASDASLILLKWINTITDKEQRARLNVTLIDYV